MRHLAQSLRDIAQAPRTFDSTGTAATVMIVEAASMNARAQAR
jgi:hypothetical protein